MSVESIVLALLQALPAGDTSVAPRDLLEVVQDASGRGEFLGDRAQLLDRAREKTRLAAHLRARAETPERRLKVRRPTDEGMGLRATREIAEALNPVVIRLREACFGRSDPPFESLAAAASWIEQHSVDRWSPEGREEERTHTASIQALCDQAHLADPWGLYEWIYRPLELEYWRGDGTEHVRRIRKDVEPLASIRRWTQFVAEYTLLPFSSLLALVLTGFGPGERTKLAKGRTAILPGLRVLSRRRLLPVGVNQIVIELDARELTDRNLRRIRQQATRPTSWARTEGSHKATRQRRSTRKQQRVVEIVRRLGGPPTTRFDSGFWQRVAGQLKKESPTAVARLYYRAVE